MAELENAGTIAERVAERLEGRKLFRVYSYETVYYMREVYANNRDHADEICSEDGDWGDIVDGNNFEVTDIEEVK